MRKYFLIVSSDALMVPLMPRVRPWPDDVSLRRPDRKGGRDMTKMLHALLLKHALKHALLREHPASALI